MISILTSTLHKRGLHSMDKKTLKKVGIGSLVTLLSISLPLVTLAWFDMTILTTKNKTIDGEVGLRSYFYAGKGTITDPYEIVSPVHFYNLTRLQNLGIFSGETYFQIGHYFDNDTYPSCVMEYNGETPVKRQYLDLKSICYGANAVQLFPIGNEGTPFVGHFDGKGIPIRNLKVTGYPEDIGVFGYVDYKGTIDGLVLDGTIDNGLDGVADTADDNVGVEIASMGYNATSGANDNLLFSADIDNLFTTAHYFKDAHLDVSKYTYTGAGTWEWSTPISMKNANGAQGTHLDRINGQDEYVTGSYSSNVTGYTYNKAYFKVNTPSEAGRPFKYEVVSSSSVIRKITEGELPGITDIDNVYVIDMTELDRSADFQNGYKQVDARLSIAATTEVDGYKFSRVIQSYCFEFYSNGDKYSGEGSQGTMFTNVYLDYQISPPNASDPDYVTNYHHGNNIGFLVGHLNGSLTNSYAYNPKMSFNKSDLNAILTETDTGLVGEIGKNVINDIDPDLGLVTNGSIGVMNLTNIYQNIRGNMTATTTHSLRGGRAQPSGVDKDIDYLSYWDFINSANYDSFWKDYLRHDAVADSDPQPIISTEQVNMALQGGVYTINTDSDILSDFNKVDFLWNKVIEGEEHGMGVFRIVTARCTLPNNYNAATDYGRYMLNNIGESVIVNDSNEKHLVYFSTAEYDHTSPNSYDWKDIGPLRGIDLPKDYAQDINSFTYPFSRDHNYCFELDLSDMDLAGSNYYMSNCKEPFLTSYLSTKLINDHGQPITSGPNFGFMFAKKGATSIERPKKLSSYISVGKPDFNKKFQPDGTTDYLPPKCIAFTISNSFGGNVSVVGNNADISIYSVDKSTASKTSGDKQLYSMRAKNVSGGSGSDVHRFFKFHVATGEVDPVDINNNMNSDDGALYAHIFKLPPGDYVIGAKEDNATANVYFLAVQGQEKGELDNTSYADLGYKIENVDFLVEQPTYQNFANYDPTSDDLEKRYALKRAQTTFSANFNEQKAQTFYIKTKDYNGDEAMWIDFEDGATTFVTYLVTYSETSSPLYIQENAVPYTQTSVTYRSTGGGGD